MYADLLKRWEQLGAVSLRFAFSRASDKSEGCKYVQDRMYHDRADIVEQFDAGAKLFVCGSRDVGEGVQECLIKIAKERIKETQGREADDAKAREWFEGLRNERYVILLSYYAEALTENRFATDVFA